MVSAESYALCQQNAAHSNYFGAVHDPGIGDIDADSDAPQLISQKLRDDFTEVHQLYLPGMYFAKSSHNAQGVARRGFSNSSNIQPNNYTKLKLYEFFLPHTDFKDLSSPVFCLRASFS